MEMIGGGVNRIRKVRQKAGVLLLSGGTVLVGLFILTLIGTILVNGMPAMSWSFLTDTPRAGMTEGGIMPAIVGTFLVTLVTMLFCIPVGVSAAVYLNEYAKAGRLTRWIRVSIRNLAGVPSIVYGLFGVALFVHMMSLGRSVLSAGLTLGVLTLPWIITTSEEALSAVPDAWRQGALALGSTRWEMIRRVVLPYAVPGMLTGVILGISRAAGETAPILFTGAAFFIPELPSTLLDSFMALPYHLYILATQHHAIETVRPLAYGTALVLLMLVFFLNASAIALRYRLRKKQYT